MQKQSTFKQKQPNFKQTKKAKIVKFQAKNSSLKQFKKKFNVLSRNKQIVVVGKSGHSAWRWGRRRNGDNHSNFFFFTKGHIF